MSPDPGSDRQLSGATVASVVRDQFGLDAASVERLGEGWDNEVFVVDGDWIFRFPKRADAIWRLEREIAMMPIIERSIGVPVPRFDKIGRANEAFPYPFVGYGRIEGLAADRVDRVQSSSGLAADIGGALTRLHGIDPALIPSHPDEPWGWEEHRMRLVEEGDHVAPYVPAQVAREAGPFLRGEMEPPPFQGPRRFLHGDIGPDHLIVEPETGRLAGIIDFGDAEVSDPVGDFVGLVSVGGYSFANEVRQHYTLPCDDGFDDRLRWAARALNLHWLSSAIHEGSDVARHQAWVIRAFQR